MTAADLLQQIPVSLDMRKIPFANCRKCRAGGTPFPAELVQCRGHGCLHKWFAGLPLCCIAVPWCETVLLGIFCRGFLSPFDEQKAAGVFLNRLDQGAIRYRWMQIYKALRVLHCCFHYAPPSAEDAGVTSKISIDIMECQYTNFLVTKQMASGTCVTGKCSF